MLKKRLACRLVHSLAMSRCLSWKRLYSNVQHPIWSYVSMFSVFINILLTSPLPRLTILVSPSVQMPVINNPTEWPSEGRYVTACSWREKDVLPVVYWARQLHRDKPWRKRASPPCSIPSRITRIYRTSTIPERWENSTTGIRDESLHFTTKYQAPVENNMTQIFQGLLEETAFSIVCVWTTSWKRAITVLLTFVLFRSGVDATVLHVQTYITILLREIVICKTQGVLDGRLTRSRGIWSNLLISWSCQFCDGL